MHGRSNDNDEDLLSTQCISNAWYFEDDLTTSTAANGSYAAVLLFQSTRIPARLAYIPNKGLRYMKLFLLLLGLTLTLFYTEASATNNNLSDEVVTKSGQAAQAFHNSTSQWGSEISQKLGASSSNSNSSNYFSGNSSGNYFSSGSGGSGNSSVSGLWAKIKAFIEQQWARVKNQLHR